MGCWQQPPRRRAPRRRQAANCRRCNSPASPEGAPACRPRCGAQRSGRPSIRTSGLVLPADHEPYGRITRPSARQRVCHRQSHNPPSTRSRSAGAEIEGRTETAPGQDATHLPVATRRSMPSPIICSGELEPEGHGDQAGHLGVELGIGEACGKRECGAADDEAEAASPAGEDQPCGRHDQSCGSEQPRLL